jgi:hypothetical protein
MVVENVHCKDLLARNIRYMRKNLDMSIMRRNRMTVRELKKELEKYDDNVEVLTKKTELLGNVGFVNSARKDLFTMFGVDQECVLLTDEYNEEE